MITDKPIEGDIWSWRLLKGIHDHRNQFIPALQSSGFFGEQNLRYGYILTRNANTHCSSHTITLLKHWECTGKKHRIVLNSSISRLRFKKKWVNITSARHGWLVTQHWLHNTVGYITRTKKKNVSKKLTPTQCYGECATKSGHWKHCLRTLVTWAPKHFVWVP